MIREPVDSFFYVLLFRAMNACLVKQTKEEKKTIRKNNKKKNQKRLPMIAQNSR